jgi:anti-sigma B factor antagonist
MALNIEGEMTIYVATELRQRIVAALQGTETVELDLSAVGEIDTAGVQLLIAAKREAAAKGRKFHILAHSPAVREVLDLLGLSADFGDPVLMPSGSA